MRKIVVLVVTVFALALTGCMTIAKQTAVKSHSERTDIFTEVTGDDPIPKGYSELTIRASIKTHLEGYHILESKKSLHGKTGYPFLLNVDGQAVVWKVDGTKEDIPLYGRDGKTSTDPNAGEGMKYALEKKIRLRAGTRKIFLGLTEENYSKEVELAIKEGELYALEFKPVYKYKTQPTRIPSFKKGIKEYEVFLNGRQI